MMITFPWWFKIFLGWFLFAMILGVVKYFARDKYIHKVTKLPPEKKARILKSYSLTIKIYKLLFWTSPIYLLILPFITYTYSKKSFFHITVMEILMYISILEDFLFKRFLFNRIKPD